MMHSLKKDWFMLAQELAAILLIAGLLAIFMIGITPIGGVRMLPVILGGMVPLAIVLLCDQRLGLNRSLIVQLIKENPAMWGSIALISAISLTYLIVSATIVAEIKQIDLRHSLNSKADGVEKELEEFGMFWK